MLPHIMHLNFVLTSMMNDFLQMQKGNYLLLLVGKLTTKLHTMIWFPEYLFCINYVAIDLCYGKKSIFFTGPSELL
jgi:hypothetical protein